MPEFDESKGFQLKSGNKTSFKMMGSSPLTDKMPEGGTGYDDETGTYYHRGMAKSDRPQAQSDIRHSGIEVEAAKQLNSGKVNRAQRRAQRKTIKEQQAIKFGSSARRKRVSERRDNKARKAGERSDRITRKRFDEMSDLGKKEYNRVIERDNKEKKERTAEKNK